MFYLCSSMRTQLIWTGTYTTFHMPSGHLLTREKSFALVNCFAWFYIGKIVVIELLKKRQQILFLVTTPQSRLLTHERFFQLQHLLYSYQVQKSKCLYSFSIESRLNKKEAISNHLGIPSGQLVGCLLQFGLVCWLWRHPIE